MAHPLTGVELKLARANDHLEVLRDEIDSFLGTADAEKPYGSVLQKDDETGKRRLCASVHRRPPPQISILIGDCLHNLRSALDHLAWKLGGDPPPNEKSSEFPIFWDRSLFRKNPSGRSGYDKIAGAEERAQAIIEDVQPFNRADDPKLDPLWMLHELSTEDKHRLPVVTGLAVEGGVEAQLIPGHPDRVDIGLSDYRGVLRLGTFYVGDPIAEWVAGELTPEPETH